MTLKMDILGNKMLTIFQAFTENRELKKQGYLLIEVVKVALTLAQKHDIFLCSQTNMLMEGEFSF